jgi:hypothetical protein
LISDIDVAYRNIERCSFGRKRERQQKQLSEDSQSSRQKIGVGFEIDTSFFLFILKKVLYISSLYSRLHLDATHKNIKYLL